MVLQNLKKGQKMLILIVQESANNFLKMDFVLMDLDANSHTWPLLKSKINLFNLNLEKAPIHFLTEKLLIQSIARKKLKKLPSKDQDY